MIIRQLLATDMDGTVIPPPHYRDSELSVREFKAYVKRKTSLCLAYVTGRHLALAEQGIRMHGLPWPKILVCDVGTSIYIRRGHTWKADGAYTRLMRRAVGGACSEEVYKILENIETLEQQEPDRQAKYKWSYYVPNGAGRKALIQTVTRKLASEGIKVNIVYSVDSATGQGLLDILPAKVAKDFALLYLARQLDLTYDQVVYAGDSGNDLLAFVSGTRAVVLRNTPKTVKDVVRATAKKKGIRNRIYFSRRSYARGVVEGCRHFGV